MWTTQAVPGVTTSKTAAFIPANFLPISSVAYNFIRERFVGSFADARSELEKRASASGVRVSDIAESPSAGAASATATPSPVASPSPSGAPAGQESLDSQLDTALDTPLSGESPVAPAPVEAAPETPISPILEPGQPEPAKPELVPGAEPPPFEFKSHAEALKAHPELRPYLGRLHEFESTFGTVANAKKVAEIVSSPEDAVMLREGAETLNIVNDLLDSGDAENHRSVLQAIRDENPERFQHLESAVFSEPGVTDRVPEPIVRELHTRTLQNQLARAQAEGNEELSAALSAILQDSQRDGGPRPAGRLDPEVQRLRDENARLKGDVEGTKQQRVQAFTQATNNEVRKSVTDTALSMVQFPPNTPETVKNAIGRQLADDIFGALSGHFALNSRIRELGRNAAFDDGHREKIVGLYKQYAAQVAAPLAAKMTSDLSGTAVAKNKELLAAASAAASRKEPGAGSAPPGAPPIAINSKMSFREMLDQVVG